MPTGIDVLALIDAIQRHHHPEWMCGACFGEIARAQTECYRCGVQLIAHPLDDPPAWEAS